MLFILKNSYKLQKYSCKSQFLKKKFDCNEELYDIIGIKSLAFNLKF